MTLPKLTAVQSLTSPNGSFGGQAELGQAGNIEMMLSMSCLLGCGARALGCITCGTNIPCWVGCAGPGAVSCVSKCF